MELRTVRIQRLALASVLVLAAALRFSGLSWGLNHAPLRDEQDFVENVGEMLAHQDWNQRFYEYPGLFFDMLRPVLALTPPSPPYHSPWSKMPPVTHFGWTGYLAARALVASGSVITVLLTYLLGAGLLGVEGGIFAALLMAVSPPEIVVSHEVRPDVLLETFVMLALLAFRRVGPRLGGDLLSGLALGAVTSIKLTGALIVPSYFLARLLAPGRRVLGALIALLAAAVFWFATTPYALVNPVSFLHGLTYQVNWHYRGPIAHSSFSQGLLFYLMTFVWSLGPLGALLLLAGLVSLRPRLSHWAPSLFYAAALVLVLCTASIHWRRLVLSAVGVVTLLAALGLEVVKRRSKPIGLALGVLTALLPLYWSATYLRTIVGPGARDRVLLWLNQNLPRGARILDGVEELGIDRTRFEVVRPVVSTTLDRLLARDSDVVVWITPDRSVVEGFDVVLRTKPRFAADALGQRPELSLRSLTSPIVVFRPPKALRAAYTELPLTRAAFSGSPHSADAPLAADGRLDTLWSTSRKQRHGDFFQVLLEGPMRVGRVEVLLGGRGDGYARDLELEVSDDGSSWRSVPWASDRGPVEEQRDLGGALVQAFLFEPVVIRGVRLSLLKDDPHPWSIAEIRLEASAS